MSVHHNRWKESILAWNITDIRHHPGVESPVADDLSRKWHNREHEENDGSSWSVLPDWEATLGIRNDIFSVVTVLLTPTLPSDYGLVNASKGDVFFKSIISHLLDREAGGSIRERQRAKARAQGFTIEGGKLWRLSTRAKDRVCHQECIPKVKAGDIALTCHRETGHFRSLDLLKTHLHKWYFWPGMDTDCHQVVLECPECKHFGPSFHNHLLQLIQCSRLFSLVSGNYLSLPSGFNGYSEALLFIDIYSGFVWGTMLKKTGDAESTINGLGHIVNKFATPASFMADRGRHFDNLAVWAYCKSKSINTITTPEYSPWMNGLIEGTNKLLLNILRQLCSPNMDELVDNDEPINAESIPYNWPKHFDRA